MASALVDFSNSLADAVERAGQSVVGIAEGGRHGVSGTVWRDGVVLTAEHTIRRRDVVTVILPNGEKTTGKVAGRDQGRDVAIVRLDGGRVSVAQIADVSRARVGHVVFAVGRRSESGLNASYGIISAIGDAWRTWQGELVDRHFTLDLLPYPGFSGGPLIDAEGHVLGINTSGPRGGVLTIPSSTLEKVVPQLMEKGSITRGYLGAGLQPVTLPQAAKDSGAIKDGLLVVMVAEGGPAERAGLLVGDIFVAIDGTPISSTTDLLPALDGEKINKPVKVRLLRGGKPTEIEVVVSERPKRQ
jgi:S1-C subfamily serine protease